MTLNQYREIQPCIELRQFVHCIWFYSASEPENEHIIVPDGRPEFIIHCKAPYREKDADFLQPQALFAGQLTRPLRLVSSSPADMVGIRFRPDGARAFLGRSIDGVTDKRVDMFEQHRQSISALLAKVGQSQSDEATADILCHYVLARIGNAKPDPIVRCAIETLSNGGDEFDHPGITVRQFQRRFKRETGVSARMYRAIRRFREVFNRLSAVENETWVERALETGYFDQPQMARDFKRFLGCSAREWIASSQGLGLALAETTQ